MDEEQQSDEYDDSSAANIPEQKGNSKQYVKNNRYGGRKVKHNRNSAYGNSQNSDIRIGFGTSNANLGRIEHDESLEEEEILQRELGGCVGTDIVS